MNLIEQFYKEQEQLAMIRGWLILIAYLLGVACMIKYLFYV